jgi:two-component system, OmpR family, response regulator
VTINTYLIEDNAIIRENLTSTLQELSDVKMLAYADTELEGIKLAQSSRDWNLIIVDLFLREGSGMEIVAALAKRKPDQKVVVLTNYATPEIRRRCLGLGANAVFDKSTELDGLIDFCISLSGDAVTV